jgi:putative acetyltransferase
MRGINPFVAVADGHIVGYADVQVNGYIDHFFVSPEVARQGIGSLLMKKIHETARERGLSSLSAEVSETARAFFERWGFAIDAAQTVSIRGVELRNYRMSKNRLETC